ncbi:UNVERIFIED_CONTAM: hypothetical protein PYX00_002376 [Menopon gallinae]|uniref:BED-type domain-containing protein n=1 Tax=Menopon gallinae TaxID=328185 RepID=A0AAW2IH18_9NEOP
MASTSSSSGSIVYTYKKLVVPVSMRSIYWKYFGFPASETGEIITKLKIICILCKSQIAYNKNTSNLRMHLQNKHLPELIKIESQMAVDNTGKPKVVKKPIKLKNEIPLGVEETLGNNEEFYISEESSQVFQIEENDVDEDNVYSQVTKKMFPHVTAEESKSITDAIANFIIADLQPPQVVDGRGFQRLLVTLKSPCEIPSTMKLTYDLIPKIYKTTKENLQAEIYNLTSDFGLTLEEWTSINNQVFLTISVYYQNANNTAEYKVLSTVHVSPTTDSTSWEHIFDSILSEWNLDFSKITAITFATNREEILAALFNKGYTLVPCLEHTIKECTRLCFEQDVIKEVVCKVRGIISTIFRTPNAWDSLLIQESTTEIEGNLQLDNENFLMSTLNMIEQFVARRSIIENILQEHIEFPMKNGLELLESEWELLQDVINVLEPFKVTLMTLSEEKIPLISLLKPLLWQVINNKLNVKDTDSVTLLSLKKIIVDHLRFRYNDEQISTLLQIATMLDPRFKLLPYSSEEEKNSTGDIIKEMLTKIIEEHGPPTEEPVEKKHRISGMELLLGNYSFKKVKVDPSENASIEYNQFYNDAAAPLDSCPIQWWTTNRSKYSNLALLADKYICMPACATFPGKISVDTQNSFYVKRSSFTTDHNLLDKVLFLHANQSPL